MIAVTGSDGKTTTTTIIAKLLEAAGRTVHLGGNIGRPLLCDTPDIAPTDLAVLELSSFQLMTMDRSPRIAVMTNLSPNHLDVHKSYGEYIAAKENIFTHQTARDIAVFNADNESHGPLRRKGPGPGAVVLPPEGGGGRRVPPGHVHCLPGGPQGERVVLDTADIKLPGVHNIENYMAAVAAVDGHGAQTRPSGPSPGPSAAWSTGSSWSGSWTGVRWYNDSIASSPSRTIAGLRSFPEKVILIAGGKDKGISYDAIGPEINEHVKALILCGATAGVIRAAVEKAANFTGLPITEVDSYQSAVALARETARPGDVVLLSPASTSFDRFANFMERGRVFKDLVNAAEIEARPPPHTDGGKGA